MNHHRSRHHGVMLWEILIAVILTSLCVVIAAHLTRESMHQIRDLPATDAAIMGQQHLLNALRHDAWSASRFEPIAGGVRITQPDGASASWTVDDTGTVSCAAPGTPLHTWAELAPGLTLKPDGAVLVARWPAKGQVSEIRCTSQILLAGGGR
jgi:hypothetical protein